MLLMHESGFTKLFNTILTSSIWNEDDKTRIVWITMLALANRYGEVGASIDGLAHQARMKLDDCKKAIHILESPDASSRTPDNEGRRISKIQGGWQILNYSMYRKKTRTRAEYMREYRKNQKIKQCNNKNQAFNQ
jgi:hypothetical protein